MRRSSWALWLAVAGCLRAPHTLEGATCDLDPDCGPALRCVGGRCSADPELLPDGGAAPNLIPNGGFEAGVTGWDPGSSHSLLEPSTRARTGQGAARVFEGASGSGSFLSVTLQRTAITSPLQAGRYCAEIYVARGSERDRFEMTMRQYQTPDVWKDTVAAPVLPANDEWTRIVGSIDVVEPYTRYINLRVHSVPAPNAEYFLDDARLWRTETASCDP